MVWQILDLLKEGISEKEIISDFPSLKKDHIRAALDYASSLTKEGYVLLNTQPQISNFFKIVGSINYFKSMRQRKNLFCFFF